MDEASGDGSAEMLDDGSIDIEFEHRDGDEAILKAKRDTAGLGLPIFWDIWIAIQPAISQAGCALIVCNRKVQLWSGDG